MIEQTLNYGDRRIRYRVFYPAARRCKLAIHVHPDGSVRVDAPPGTALPQIKGIVARRARWLSGHLQRIETGRADVLTREYVSGESHFYLGRRYVLKLSPRVRGISEVKMRQGRIEIATHRPTRAGVRGLLADWYAVRAQAVFRRRLDRLAATLPWIRRSPALKLVEMKRQWGNCSPRGVVKLNPHLVKAPARCIDYVLLHELCHLKIRNHGPGFYRLLGRHMPDWEAVKGRLDGMAEMLLNE